MLIEIVTNSDLGSGNDSGIDDISFRSCVPDTLYTEVEASICEDEEYTLPDGTIVSDTGTYITEIINSDGCLEEIFTILSFFPSGNYYDSVEVCYDSSYILPDGSEVEVAGDYVSYLTSVTGCDSIIHTALTVLQEISSAVNIHLCTGETYTLPDGTIVDSTDTFAYFYTAISGCDSTVYYYISVSDIVETSASDDFCEGDVFVLPDGSAATEGGVYEMIFTASGGCDSIVHFYLTEYPSYSDTVYDAFATGSSYVLPDGSLAVSAGTYTTLLYTEHDCDSIITTILETYQNIDAENEFTFTLSPNPAQTYCVVSGLENNELFTVELRSITGSTISLNNYFSYDNSIHVEIPEFLPGGSYILSIVTSGGKASKVLIIE